MLFSWADLAYFIYFTQSVQVCCIWINVAFHLYSLKSILFSCYGMKIKLQEEFIFLQEKKQQFRTNW